MRNTRERKTKEKGTKLMCELDLLNAGKAQNKKRKRKTDWAKKQNKKK